jgi:hypothetical protein
LGTGQPDVIDAALLLADVCPSLLIKGQAGFADVVWVIF